MKLFFHVSLIAVLPLALAACGDSGGGDDVDSGISIIDSSTRDRTIDSSTNNPDSSTTCDPVSNNGCGAPQKCSLGPTDMFICQPAGAGMQGAACGTGTTDDGCAIGFVCLSTNKCARYCNAGSTCPMEGASMTACNIQLQNAAMQAIPGATVCGAFTSCDVLAQDCPTATDGCFLTQSGPQCGPPGTVADGQTCTNANSCMKGSVCLNLNMAGNKCHHICRLGGGAPACTTGTCTMVNGLPAMTGLCI